MAMHKALLTLAAAVLAAAPGIRAQQTDVMQPIHQFVEGFNKGDVASALAACAEQTSIIDEFPPHEWHGAGACATWANAYDADARARGVTDGVVALGTPRHVDVTGDRAYVVIPATYRYKQKGKPVTETGSLLTVALQKGATGWRMTAWAWTKR